MKYKIFGKTIEINTSDNIVREIIKKEFQLYPIANDETDVEINIVDRIESPKKFSNSPTIHSTFNNGFIARFPSTKISYKKEGKHLIISVELIKTNTLKLKLKKLKSMAYKSSVENITAILYELVLVPVNYFFNDNVLIHASSMKNTKTGETIMFGGTGGVGKTSLELLLCRELGYSFISDDIAVMDKNGYLYPNLAYPKIYAYNTEGKKDIKSILFEERDIFDRIQWSLSKNIRGLNKARRTIAPEKIYQSVETNINELDEYYILSRDSSIKEIVITEINPVKASKMTLDIIKNEYFEFNKHLIWHEYNACLLSIEPIVKLDFVFDRWLKIYNHILKNKLCYNIKIPNDIKHTDFIESFKSIF